MSSNEEAASEGLEKSAQGKALQYQSSASLSTAPTLLQSISIELNSDDPTDEPGKGKEDLGSKGEPAHEPSPDGERPVRWKETLSSTWSVALLLFRDGRSCCKATSLLVSLCAVMVVETFVTSWFSTLFRDVTNALMLKDEVFFDQTVRKVLLACALYMPLFCAEEALKGAFALEWRRRITEKMLAHYISHRQAYYRMKSQATGIDNPDQRIGQDIADFTLNVVNLIVTMLGSGMKLLVMSGILLDISLNLFLYLVVGSMFTSILFLKVFGSRLMRLTRKTLEQEANLRFCLIRIREHAESIAFYQGAPFELMRCLQFFSTLLHVHYQKLAVWVVFSGGHKAVTSFANFVPTLFMGPQILRGEADLGTIGQVNVLFGILLTSMTTLVSQIQILANLGAQAVRVDQLRRTLEQMEEEASSDGQPGSGYIALRELQGEGEDDGENGGSSPGTSPQDSSKAEPVRLQLEDVTLRPPAGAAPLVSNLSLTLRSGDSMLLCGESGIGKSSLLRAIGGLWAAGHGKIARCQAERCFFVPQEPYLCLGSLRENAEYPGGQATGDAAPGGRDAEIERALAAANLGYLVSRHGLDVQVDFDSVLSGGEKQRLGFVRLLLRHRLEFAILDEATSALDAENEDRLYSLLAGRVPCYASVGHRANLERFHTHKLLLCRRPEGGCEGSLARNGGA